MHSYAVHEYKIQVNGQWQVRKFTCLGEINQECPGCKAGLKRKNRGVFNVIQRNRPVYRKGQDGKAIKDPAGNYITDGWADTVVVANVGGPTAEMLRKADGDYRGLMGRDFQVQFSGDTFQSWNMTPVLDASGSSNPTPLSENDQALMAAKHDLDKYMQPPSAQEAAQIVARYGQNSGAAPGNQAPAVGGVGGPQGNAGLAQPPNQFLAGAPVGAAAPVNAFGAAAGVPPQQPQPVPVPVPGAVQPPPVQPSAQPMQPQPIPAGVPAGVHPAGEQQGGAVPPQQPPVQPPPPPAAAPAQQQ